MVTREVERMGFGDTFIYTLYTSDNGTQYVVKLTQADATAGGFGGSVNPLNFPAWPFNYRDLRHVTGYDTSFKPRKGRLILATNGNVLYKNGGTWTNNNTGITYQTQGAEGERRPASHIGGS